MRTAPNADIERTRIIILAPPVVFRTYVSCRAIVLCASPGLSGHRVRSAAGGAFASIALSQLHYVQLASASDINPHWPPLILLADAHFNTHQAGRQFRANPDRLPAHPIRCGKRIL